MNAMVIEEVGRAWGGWLAHTNAWAIGMLVAVLILDRLLARRITAGWRMALYGAVFIRVFAPGDWATPVGVFGSEFSVDAAGVGAAGWIATASEPAASGALADGVRPAMPAWSWGTALLAAHVLGSALLLARIVAGYRTLARIRRTSAPARGVTASWGRVVEHRSVGPLAMGIRDPMIVLPSAALQLDADELAAIVRHEQSHLRHRDPTLQSALSVACALAWPIVALWLTASRLRTLMEVRADDEATRSLDRGGTKRYGALMLRVAAMGGMTPAASVGLSHDNLATRIRALGREPRTPALVQALAVGLAAATCVALVAERTAAEPSEESAPVVAATQTPTTAVDPPDCVLDRPWHRPDDPQTEAAHERFDAAQRLMATRDFTLAVKEMEEAAWLSASVQYDDLAAESAGRLVGLSVQAGDPEGALAWAKHASAAYRRLEPTRGEVRFLRSAARVRVQAGDLVGAEVDRQRATQLEALCP